MATRAHNTTRVPCESDRPLSHLSSLPMAFNALEQALFALVDAERDLSRCWSTDVSVDDWIRAAERAHARTLEAAATVVSLPVAGETELELQAIARLIRIALQSDDLDRLADLRGGIQSWQLHLKDGHSLLCDQRMIGMERTSLQALDDYLELEGIAPSAQAGLSPVYHDLSDVADTAADGLVPDVTAPVLDL